MKVIDICLILFNQFIVLYCATTNDCCQTIYNGLVLERADYRACQMCPMHLITDQSATLRCRPERNLSAKNYALNFYWRFGSHHSDASEHIKITKTIFEPGSYSEMTFIATTTKDAEVAIFCNNVTSDANLTDPAHLEFKICANLAKPDLECVAYPSQSQPYYLIVDCNWKIKNQPELRTICIPNYTRAKFSLSETSRQKCQICRKFCIFSTLQYFDLKLRDFGNCTNGLCQSSICIRNHYKSPPCLNEMSSSLRKNNLTIVLNAELRSSDGRDIVQAIDYPYIFDLKSIYRQHFKPVIDFCDAKSCYFQVHAPNLIYFVISSSSSMLDVFEFEIKIRDINFNKTFQHKTNSTFFNGSSNNVSFIVDHLLPNRFYEFQIKYRILPSLYHSETYVLKSATKPSEPEINVFYPPGAYYFNENELLLLWQTVPLEDQYGPSFAYVIRSSDGAELSSVSNFRMDFVGNETVFELTCRNKVGFCPNVTSIAINKHLIKPHYVETIADTENDRIVVQWKPLSDSHGYTVFWCKAHLWIHCNYGLQWANVSSNVNEFSVSIKDSNFANFVFGVSSCYDSGCSSIRKASRQEQFEFSTLTVYPSYEKNIIILKFDSDNRFTNQFHIIINSSSTIHINKMQQENGIALFCNEIKHSKVVSLQITAFRIVNNITHKSRTLSQSINTHCEIPNLGFVGQIFTILISLLLPIILVIGFLYWRMTVKVKNVISQFDIVLDKLAMNSEYKDHLEVKKKVYSEAIRWFNSTFLMTWQNCEELLRTDGCAYFECPNYIIFPKNNAPNLASTSTAGTSSADIAGSSMVSIEMKDPECSEPCEDGSSSDEEFHDAPMKTQLPTDNVPEAIDNENYFGVDKNLVLETDFDRTSIDSYVGVIRINNVDDKNVDNEPESDSSSEHYAKLLKEVEDQDICPTTDLDDASSYVNIVKNEENEELLPHKDKKQ